MLSYKESLKILKEANALIEGHFILSSGLHSPQYVQCAQLMSKPDKAKKICESLSEKINSEFKEFLIATEPHIIHQMNKYSSSSKKFIPVPGSDGSCGCNNCPFMELNTIEKLYLCLLNNSPKITLSDKTLYKAIKPLNAMLEMSKSIPIKI